MEWQELIIDGYGRVLQVLERALDGLTQDDLNQQPHPDYNSMGWLTWHLTRVQDDHIADLVGEQSGSVTGGTPSSTAHPTLKKPGLATVQKI